MGQEELPDNQADRVDWVIRAPDNQELRRRYDIWAAQYDGDVGSVDDYLAPLELAKTATRHLTPDMSIIDAGAGTGLVGEALQREGFNHLTALDFSENMLDIARTKGIYAALHQCDLSQQTALDADCADALVSCGTTTQVPCASLREYARLVRPGGKIIFAAVQGTWDEFGYADVLAELESAGKLRVTERGQPFQMMPTTEPQFICEIWVMNVS
ncbi:class I SAM-dependent DNA methyltransferase [Roseovarius rhodophyticola]|uniref:Class I SAM-dependent methyltransferase n=1 Tax=Roseovarius rhodophyticola TaxID=3080827 RepID=A0ABZ2TME3_9RHOB|nr:class I SAM-dependent methyltransferase [Roseovarius sp. W115]MDV2929885.1 class I SAM-dependent methyltransferase [Roseovarius sp. W115]